MDILSFVQMAPLTHGPHSSSRIPEVHEKDLSSQTWKKRGREGTAGKLDSAFSGRGTLDIMGKWHLGEALKVLCSGG